MMLQTVLRGRGIRKWSARKYHLSISKLQQSVLPEYWHAMIRLQLIMKDSYEMMDAVSKEVDCMYDSGISHRRREVST